MKVKEESEKVGLKLNTETISKVKRQPSEWEKIIANEATDKQLISKYTNNFCSSIPEK